ncbi:MAG: DUF5916 domain-containing protein [Chitinophagales bacterium]|nr:carbohydrate binding family 9 domain-containing protein [Bacteroidota bacterium]MBK8488380.1 carbohydrate binding family 9 domain-containing protein [Bacteroidota bacterium]MBP9189688.1 carbohydrate binding family 9 domain-containing protein [Chitinophagales bacterium]
MFKSNLLVSILLSSGIVFSQDAGFDKNKKELTATRIDSDIKIDGDLNEEAWSNAEIATDFIQFQFKNNLPSAYRTEVKVLYDNTAVYFGAVLYDPSPDSIIAELARRDEFGNGDFFGIVIDTYADGLNGFEFIMMASGVQNDAKMIDGGNEDFAWDAVWQSETHITNQGWVTEIRIPYSAIRFPKKDIQDWGIQFFRDVKHNRDKSSWSYVNPEESGWLQQAGALKGIENIEAPVRLSVSPYVSAYYDVYNDKPIDVTSTGTSLNYGADLKYGISDAFTLDMTLIPDFGQVQSDNQILNLTPFEVYYNENRQFFTEGVELFTKGDIFYTRRIGGRPIGFNDVYNNLNEGDEVIANPQNARLLNAFKISGRTTNNTGIGILNAIETETYATIQDAEGNTEKVLTSPLTNRSVIVFDQSLKNNSDVYFSNTNVIRNGSYYDANVSAAGLDLRNEKNSIRLRANGALSQKFFNADSTALGEAFFIELGKISGNFNYGANVDYTGDTYEPNDMGFSQINNIVNYNVHADYSIYEPFWIFNNAGTYYSVDYSRIINPDAFQNFSFYLEGWGTFKNNMEAGIFYYAEPITTYDYFEARSPGRYYTYPTNNNVGGYFSSDYSKKLAVSTNMNYRWFDEEDRNRFNFSLYPTYRINDKMNFSIGAYSENWKNDVGWVNTTADSIIFGRRDVRTIEGSLYASYTPNTKMSFSINLRQYWSYAAYNQFYNLEEDGSLGNTTYDTYNDDGTTDDDINFNAFNIDFSYTWYFAPGSELSVVWKNAIYQFGSEIAPNYFENMDLVFDSPQDNNFSIKILYYLDYLYLKKKSN